jgi:kexin
MTGQKKWYYDQVWVSLISLLKHLHEHLWNGAQNGGQGKRSIFVFAGGNGGASSDQCNFDGYTNSIYSMTTAAVDREALLPYYSEMCSVIIASGWISGSGDHTHRTDVAWKSVKRCTSTHGGTSATAP